MQRLVRKFSGKNQIGKKKKITCFDCDGLKTNEKGEVCPTCNGKGYLEGQMITQ